MQFDGFQYTRHHRFQKSLSRQLETRSLLMAPLHVLRPPTPPPPRAPALVGFLSVWIFLRRVSHTGLRRRGGISCPAFSTPRRVFKAHQAGAGVRTQSLPELRSAPWCAHVHPRRGIWPVSAALKFCVHVFARHVDIFFGYNGIANHMVNTLGLPGCFPKGLCIF